MQQAWHLQQQGGTTIQPLHRSRHKHLSIYPRHGCKLQIAQSTIHSTNLPELYERPRTLSGSHAPPCRPQVFSASFKGWRRSKMLGGAVEHWTAGSTYRNHRNSPTLAHLLGTSGRPEASKLLGFIMLRQHSGKLLKLLNSQALQQCGAAAGANSPFASQLRYLRTCLCICHSHGA